MARRDLVRDAVLRWTMFFRPARSIRELACCRASLASAGVAAERTFLIAVRSSLRAALLWAVRLFVWRIRFLADLMRGTVFPWQLR